MAIQIPVITEFIDQGLKDAKSAFGNFKASVKDAEGAMGKFRAGASSAIDIVKANAGTFALGAGAAFVTFAAQGIKAFQDVALKADEFSAKTGLAIEDASRWREVTGDMGVNSDAVATAIGKMNREIASNPKLVRDLGDDIIYARDGSLDANATFLNLIQRLKDIKDPAERAKEGARIFGRGWQDMSLLVEAGADKLRASLAAVSDQKVITKDEVDKAKKFRDNMNDLKDASEDFAIVLGETLVPVLADLVGYLAQGAAGTVNFFKVIVDTGYMAYKDLTDWSSKSADSADKDLSKVHDAFHRNVVVLTDTQEALDLVKQSYDNLKADIQGDVDLRNLELQIGRVKEAAEKAFDGTHEDFLNYQNDVDRTRLTILEMGGQLDIQNQKTLKIYVDNSDIIGALGYLKALDAMGGTFTVPTPNQFGRLTGGRAMGGPVVGGSSYLVGENGPEIFTPGSSGSITPNGAIGGNITINMAPGANGDDVVRALQDWTRRNGAIPLATTTTIRR